MDDQRSSGFTLVELLIALSILVILITGAIPAMGDIIERQRLYSAAETIAADLRRVRNEALSRGDNAISVSFKPGTNWCYGVATQICDCHAPPTDPTFCRLPSNNNALYEFSRHANSFSKITLSNASFLQGAIVSFDGFRGLSQPGTLTLSSATGMQLAIKVSLMGRVRICTPNGHSGLRYSAC